MNYQEMLFDTINWLTKMKADELYKCSAIMKKINILYNGSFRSSDFQLGYLVTILNEIFPIIFCEDYKTLFSELFKSSEESHLDVLIEFWDYSISLNNLSVESKEHFKNLGLYEIKSLDKSILPTLVLLSILQMMPKCYSLQCQQYTTFFLDIARQTLERFMILRVW